MSRNSTTPYTLKTPNIKHSVAATQIPKFAGSIIYSKSVLSLETIIFVKDHLHLGNPNSINLGRWRVNEKGEEMPEKGEVVGYYTEDGNIYCVECINRDSEIMKIIEQAITAEDSEESVYFCEGCEKEIK